MQRLRDYFFISDLDVKSSSVTLLKLELGKQIVTPAKKDKIKKLNLIFLISSNKLN